MKYTTPDAVDHQLRQLDRRLDELERSLSTTNRRVIQGRPVYLAIFSPGVSDASGTIGRISIPTAVQLFATLPNSHAHSGAAATAATTLTIYTEVDAVRTAIGSVNFAAGAAEGTFTFVSPRVLTEGSVLEVENQATPDATLADITITFAGQR